MIADYQFSHLCNNSCTFCISGHLTRDKVKEQIGMADLEKVRLQMQDLRQKKMDRIVLLGGEPTLQKEIFKIIELTQEYGFKQVILFTNGAKFHDQEFMQRLLEYDFLDFKISIQGPTAPLHNRVVQNQNAFERIVSGLEILSQKGRIITTNTVITALIQNDLNIFASLFSRYQIKLASFDLPNPEDMFLYSQGQQKAIQKFVPDMAQLKKQIPLFMQALDKHHVEFAITNIPLCYAPQSWFRISNASEYTEIVLEQDNLNKYEYKAGLKNKDESCQQCKLNHYCDGIYGKYRLLQNNFELEPVLQIPVLEKVPYASVTSNVRQWSELLDEYFLEQNLFFTKIITQQGQIHYRHLSQGLEMDYYVQANANQASQQFVAQNKTFAYSYCIRIFGGMVLQSASLLSIFASEQLQQFCQRKLGSALVLQRLFSYEITQSNLTFDKIFSQQAVEYIKANYLNEISATNKEGLKRFSNDETEIMIYPDKISLKRGLKSLLFTPDAAQEKHFRVQEQGLTDSSLASDFQKRYL